MADKSPQNFSYVYVDGNIQCAYENHNENTITVLTRNDKNKIIGQYTLNKNDYAGMQSPIQLNGFGLVFCVQLDEDNDNKKDNTKILSFDKDGKEILNIDVKKDDKYSYETVNDILVSDEGVYVAFSTYPSWDNYIMFHGKDGKIIKSDATYSIQGIAKSAAGVMAVIMKIDAETQVKSYFLNSYDKNLKLLKSTPIISSQAFDMSNRFITNDANGDIVIVTNMENEYIRLKNSGGMLVYYPIYVISTYDKSTTKLKSRVLVDEIILRTDYINYILGKESFALHSLSFDKANNIYFYGEMNIGGDRISYSVESYDCDPAVIKLNHKGEVMEVFNIFTKEYMTSGVQNLSVQDEKINLIFDNQKFTVDDKLKKITEGEKYENGDIKGFVTQYYNIYGNMSSWATEDVLKARQTLANSNLPHALYNGSEI